MTGLERLTVASRGGTPDSRPVFLMPLARDPSADGIAIDHDMLTADRPDGQATLAHVLSPLARAMVQELNIVEILRTDRESGEKRLDDLVEETRKLMQSALEAGADGIFYRLDGAYPAMCTPLEYGGLFLERDRALLESVKDARFNLLFVAAGRETYMDALSDLPAHAMGFMTDNVITVEKVRSLRSGAIASNDPSADIYLAKSMAEVAA